MLASPVFLVGAERSGTTMLRLMLDGHPAIAFAEEFEYGVQYLVECGIDPAGHMPRWPDVDDYRDWLSRDRVFLLHDHDATAFDDYPRLVDSMLRAVTDNPDDAAVRGATVHFGIEHVLSIWPDARFIHIVRDPREIAPSHLRMAFAGNVWHALDKWLDAEDAIANVKQRLGDHPERIIDVRFDHLIADYRRELDRLTAFLGIEFDPAMLSYPDRTDYELPQAAETWTHTTPLSDRDIRLVEARVGRRLTDLGFEPSGLPALEVSRRRERVLRIDDKARRPARRATVVGWPQTIAEIVSVRLPGSAGERASRAVFARSNARINNQRRKSW